MEKRYYRKDGSIVWVNLTVSLVRGLEGEPKYFISVVEDITERKESESALQNSEQKLRLIFENTKDAIFWINPIDGLIINCNKAAEELLEKTKAEIIGKNQSTLHPKNANRNYTDIFRKHLESEQALYEEAEIITKSCKIKPIHITASTTIVNEKPIIQGIFRDISEQRKIELELKKSLEEREILFKELRHRVKNNLQLISSMIDLQIMRSNNNSVLLKLQEVQSLIDTIALIYSKAFEESGIKGLFLNSFIRELTSNLIKFKTNEDLLIDYQINGPDIYINTDKAIPIVLISNELIFNALKHAFVGKTHGKIKISINENSKNIHLQICDNGVGYADDINLDRLNTLGLKIVKNLTEQLNGQIKIINNNGAKIKIKIPHGELE
jgi:PAS domain S-box-containing protein